MKQKKARKQTLDRWKFFYALDIIDDKPIAKCKWCKRIFIGGGSKYNTLTFSRHMGKCDEIK